MKHALTWASFATAGALLAFALAFLTPAGAFAQDRVCPSAAALMLDAEENGLTVTEFDGEVFAGVRDGLIANYGPAPWTDANAPVSAVLVTAPGRYDIAIVMFVQADGSNCYSLTIKGEVAKTVIMLVQGRDT